MLLISEIKAADTHQLRIDILRNGVANNYRFTEDEDQSTIHLGVTLKSKLIGIGTFIKKQAANSDTENTYQLRGMAIVTKNRKMGIGTQLLEMAYIILKEKNIKSIWCNARESAVDFYTKNGFTKQGKAFNIPNIGMHYIMTKKL